MKTVYLLQSIAYPDQRYVGLTEDFDQRLQAHNHGCSQHTAKYRPWSLRAAVSFHDAKRAVDFERYLKSGPVRAFARKHLWYPDLGFDAHWSFLMAIHESTPSLLKESLPEFVRATEFCVEYQKNGAWGKAQVGGCLGFPAATLLFCIADSIGSYHRGNSTFTIRLGGRSVPILKDAHHFYILNSD